MIRAWACGLQPCRYRVFSSTASGCHLGKMFCLLPLSSTRTPPKIWNLIGESWKMFVFLCHVWFPEEWSTPWVREPHVSKCPTVVIINLGHLRMFYHWVCRATVKAFHRLSLYSVVCGHPLTTIDNPHFMSYVQQKYQNYQTILVKCYPCDMCSSFG